MAAQSCVRTQHATLSGGTADTITFSGEGNVLCVTNRHASNTMYFRFDGTAAVAAADETYVVLPLSSKTVTGGNFGSNTLSVIGTDNPYSVEIF